MSARQHQRVESTCVVIDVNDWSVLCTDIFSRFSQSSISVGINQ